MNGKPNISIKEFNKNNYNFEIYIRDLGKMIYTLQLPVLEKHYKVSGYMADNGTGELYWKYTTLFFNGNFVAKEIE